MLKTIKKIRGGIHPPENKRTADHESEVLPIPERVIIPMRQHIGAECTPTVAKGEHVFVGQIIGDSEAPLSVPIHASISGIVEAVRPEPAANGERITSVIIKSDGLQEKHPDLKPITTEEPAEMIQAIRDSGLVGLGGAGFPTYFKLTPPKTDKFDVLLINGAECEPYITSDYREMVENPIQVIRGINLALKMTGIERAIIGIEDNKQGAIDRLIKAAEDDPHIDVMSLHTLYPQGGEKQLIYAMTGREIPSGKLPSSIGVLVLSVNTVSYFAEYFETGMPLIRRRITVDGKCIKNPKNIWVPVGTSLQEVFDFCGGFVETPAKVIMGGPMMGVSQISPENTVLRQTNAVLAMSKDEINTRRESACIRCGRCAIACPMSLQPFALNLLIANERYEEAVEHNLMDCIECGSCVYMCPASRYLVQSFRMGKAKYRNQQVRDIAKRNAEIALKAQGLDGKTEAQEAK